MSANTVVRTNVLSLNSHRNLGLVANQQARSSQRLSSGFRINSAADDAAGLGISEKMRAQIRGLDQASRNGQDGISLIQTAEGALDTVNEILIRVRELVIQAANDTNVGGDGSQSDRLRIQDEIDQLMDEIDAIAGRTEFNTRTLLDGGLSTQGVIRGGEWESVQQVRVNAPARITSLDQLLRTTSSVAFDGDFSALLNRIGIDDQGMESIEEWISTVGTLGAADSLGWHGLEQAIDAAMGRDADNDVPGEGTNRWGRELYLRTGLTFNNARDLLDAFVQGLSRPNNLRANDNPAGPTNPAQQGFADWENFIATADPNLNAGTFARAHSTSGGVAIWEALAQDAEWLTANGIAFTPEATGILTGVTFAQVRAAFTNMTNGENSPGWLNGQVPGEAGMVAALAGWLERRFGDIGEYTHNVATSEDDDVIEARNALDDFNAGLVTLPQDQIDLIRGQIGELEENIAMWQAMLDEEEANPDGFIASLEVMIDEANAMIGIISAFNAIDDGDETDDDVIAANAALDRLNELLGTSYTMATIGTIDLDPLSLGDLFDEAAGELTTAGEAMGGAIGDVLTSLADVLEGGGELTPELATQIEGWIEDAETAIGELYEMIPAGMSAEEAAQLRGLEADLANAIAAVERVENAPARWEAFINTYLTADTEIVHIDRWVPREAERERGTALWFQIGANSGQGINVEIGSMSTGTLFGREGANHTAARRIIDVLDVFGYNVQDGVGSNFGHTIAGNAVDTVLEAIDGALAIATRQRSELGAVQNRLEFAIENLDIASENLSAANSRIRDADMAREMMSLTQANVLQQAAISMLAQANQAPQSVLQLLG